MITKTYLDGRLNELEEKLKRRIELKIGRENEEMSGELANIKNEIKSALEKIVETRDFIDSCIKEQNGFEREMEEVKIRLEKIERVIGEKAEDFKKEDKEKESDIIVSEI